jgi:cytochrome P450
MFTPRKMRELEPKIREFCVRSLEPFVGADGFDFVGGLGKQMPMRVISQLLGIPEEDQETVRDQVDAELRTEAGKPMARYSEDGDFATAEIFAEYVDWRSASTSPSGWARTTAWVPPWHASKDASHWKRS